MQIRAITVNAAGMMPERNIPGNRNQVQPTGSMLSGAQCRVTISREGRELSRQNQGKTERSIEGIKTERMLLRQQREAEQERDIKEGYRQELANIEKTINSLNSSYLKKEDPDATIEKKQEVLRAMNSQKQLQMEENQKRAKEARQMAMQSAEYQEDIDKNNRDLFTLLKSMEEAEKAKEEQETGKSENNSDGSSTSDAQKTAGDVIRNSANQFMVSSVKREWDVQEMIAGLGDEGHQLIDQADMITRRVTREIENIRAAFDDRLFTDDERAELMERLREDTVQNYEDVEDFRGWGLQMLQDTLECKLNHIADDPLRGMPDTKESMMLSAADADLGQAIQNKLDEGSEELADEVEKLIDERNNVDRIRQDEEEEEEEPAKEAEEAEENKDPNHKSKT